MFILLAGCTSPINTQNKIVAVVSVEPHAFLVERIGADRVQVEVLVPTGKEPETYQITPDKLAVFSYADLFFRTGMPIEEPLLPKLESISDNLHIVDLRTGLTLRALEIHHHGEEHTQEHDPHAQTDPHIWFAPTLLISEAATVLRALEECDPEGLETYRKNYETLLQEIESVRQEIAEKLSTKKGEIVFVFHPAYRYFCEEFGLKQWAIEYEGKTPKPQQIAELIDVAKGMSGKPKIFVQPEFSQSAAQALAESIGAKVLIHSNLEHDVLKSMRQFTEYVAE